MKNRLTLRALRLSVETGLGEAHRLLDFEPGLNLLRADNTSGKSTALQAIIYALGLEGMLSPNRQIPLAHAMTDHIELGSTSAKVLRSRVELEFENRLGDVVAIERSVVDPARDGHLITVTKGPKLTKPGEYATGDYFVRVKGAAQNEAGFHRFLTDFLGLELPRVTRNDGSESPLYLETLFPYFYVEQKHGWTGIQARMPNYLGIREVGKRSAEFILGLTAFERALAIQRLTSNIAELETKWQTESDKLQQVARAAQVVIQRPPGRISRSVGTGDIIPTAAVGSDWVELDFAIQILRREAKAIANRDVPVVRDVSAQVESELRSFEIALQKTVTTSSGLWDERSELASRRDQLEFRLEALEEDLQRHKDTRTLRKYGSELALEMIADHICPTCHQDLEDGSDITDHAMTIAENIAFIERQIATFKSSKADTERVLGAVDVRLQSLAEQAHDFRGSIRSAKDTLSSPNNTPSVSDVRRQLQVAERLATLEERRDELTEIRAGLEDLQETWRAQRALLDAARTKELPEQDAAKLDQLEQLVRGQLDRYGFKSISPFQVDIDRETYRPVNDGYDLGFDLSASDMIRVIWSYLFGIMRVGTQGGAHLGILIFDEPRQQETARESYQELLSYAAEEGATGTQIIFATSEESSSLRTMLDGSSYHLIDLPKKEKLLVL